MTCCLSQMTLEAFPSESNYRNLGDVFTRPTIEQLIDGKGNDVKDAEKAEDEDKATPLTHHVHGVHVSFLLGRHSP